MHGCLNTYDIPLLVSPLSTALLCSFILIVRDHPVSPMYVYPYSQSILYTAPFIFKLPLFSFIPEGSLELKAVLMLILLHLISILSFNRVLLTQHA